jgi:putative DNA primase/helicase
MARFDIATDCFESCLSYGQLMQNFFQNEEREKAIKWLSENGLISLQELASQESQDVLEGVNNSDRSEALTKAIKEWYGWQNWLQTQQIDYLNSAEELAHKAGENLGLDQERVERILKSVDADECQPALLYEGTEEDCWQKIRRLDGEVYEKKCPESIKARLENPDLPPNVEKTFPQIAFEQLYGDRMWICVNDLLYYWTGTHYAPSLDTVEIGRISQFCDAYAVEHGAKSITKHANPAETQKVLRWVKQKSGIDPTLINPAGINCTNGVIEIIWDGSLPSWQVVQHDPSKHFYLFEPTFAFNPDADAMQCDTLLECLDKAQQDIFLRTIAASLDLPTVRKFKGRLLRALLLKGEGSNGKDALREAVKLLYGKEGLTGCSFSDFEQYDRGRKFPLAKLSRSRVNWASESQNFTDIDRLQSLKMAITGEAIDIESKGKDEYTFEPNAVLLFNINDTPNLKAWKKAISSRYAVLDFNKTFSINPDPSKGELKANPRFKYDPEFVQSEVLPAFLNKVLVALKDLMAQGIDYSVTEKALDDIRKEACHLYAFCADSGLKSISGAKTYVGDIWGKLERWYIDNGTLVIENQRRMWNTQVKPSDKNVKSANQVTARFKEIFPHAKIGKDGNKAYFEGLGFSD